MTHRLFVKIACLLVIIGAFGFSLCAESISTEQKSTASNHPIGFTLNFGGLTSMTFEGRFMYGLWPHISIVAAPSYQNTPELPWYHPKKGHWSLFDFRRAHMGVGVRGNFNDLNNWDGFFLEGLLRAGATWVGTDAAIGSLIPSVIFGYSSVFESGYTVSLGVGFEWEFLLGKATGLYSDFLKTAYYGITKFPLTGELSMGWSW